MAKKHLNPALLSTAVAAGLMATAMPANAVKFSASGQINKMFGDVDNGTNDALGFFDSAFSGSRIRFRGSEELDNGLTIGGYQEWQMSRNSAFSATLQANDEFGEGGAATHNERHMDIFMSSSWGKVSLGQGNGAANGTSEVDLSGTWRMDYVGGNSCAVGSITFGNTAVTVNTGGQLSIDGLSRNQRIRYDTPTLGEVFSFAVSQGNGGATELGGWLNLTVGSTQISAAIGTADRNGRTAAGTMDVGLENTMISGSVLLGNGLNFTVAQTEQESSVDTDDNEISYFKVGYKTGKHAISVSKTDGDGGTQAIGSGLSNLETEGTQIGYNYALASSLNLYAGWRTIEIDDDAAQAVTNADDVDAWHAGAHLTFSSN